jgi:hypothetical protein
VPFLSRLSRFSCICRCLKSSLSELHHRDVDDRGIPKWGAAFAGEAAGAAFSDRGCRNDSAGGRDH